MLSYTLGNILKLALIIFRVDSTDPEVTRAVWRDTGEGRLGFPLSILACFHMLQAVLNIWVETVHTILGLNGNFSPLSHLHAYEVGTVDRQITKMLLKEGQVLLTILCLKMRAIILLWSRECQVSRSGS